MFGELEARKNKKTGQRTGWRARYVGPDLDRHSRTFGDKLAAEAWLAAERKLIEYEEWTPPSLRAAAALAELQSVTLEQWARQYIAERNLTDSTRREYARVLEKHIVPTLGELPLADITVNDVATWHANLKAELAEAAAAAKRTTGDGSGQAAQAYKFLSSVLKGAVKRGLIDTSPARVEGAGRTKRKHEPVVVAPAQVRALAQALPEKYRALADLLAWSGLRIGEARALRLRDLDIARPKRASVTVAQNVTRGKKGEGEKLGAPKSSAGSRTIAIPEPIALALKEHVEKHPPKGQDGLVFPSKVGTLLPEATWRRAWIRARNAAGLPHVRTHDLRHTSLTMAARTGATTAELMLRAGHSDPKTALTYQHAAAERDRQIADRMAEMMRADAKAGRKTARKAR